MDPKLLNLKMAAAFLGCSEIALRRRIARKQVPCHKWGRSVVFSVEELNAFINQLPSVEAARTATKKPN